jgi:putative ATPase
MEDLFKEKTITRNLPLAARMRPEKLEDFIGQNHILAQGKLLTRLIESDNITSIIFYGPPGTGKTTLANIISNTTGSNFTKLSAVESNVADIRRVIAEAKNRNATTGKKTLLFIDEIHRFNKAQQDVLLPDIENRVVEFIGATTHNPFFSVIAPLVSRSQIFQLFSLKKEDIADIILRASKDKEKGFGKQKIKIDKDALEFFAKTSEGDARRALNAFEIAVLTTNTDSNNIIHITLDIASESMQKKAVVYDQDEDSHYDTISAYIKSMRGSDPDAALYWLAKMLYAGEDPAFIARRLVICSSEDVGNADPNALIIATSALQAVEFIGMPEARIPLAQATIYVASAPKSNASYMAIDKAMEDIEKGRVMEVPDHLKDSHYKSAEKLGHGIGYKYSHDAPLHYIKQDYMPEKNRYYTPGDLGFEKKIKQWLDYLQKHGSNE